MPRRPSTVVGAQSKIRRYPHTYVPTFGYTSKVLIVLLDYKVQIFMGVRIWT